MPSASINSIDLWTLWTMVLLMGCRHGFDMDHLATIDNLTRHFSIKNQSGSRYCGVLFSLGHGLVVLAIAADVNYWIRSSTIPAWLETVGTLVSVFFLVLLSILNLWSLRVSPRHEPIQFLGIKSAWFKALTLNANLWSVLLIGALFAISFDTVSQAALFAVLGSRYGGIGSALFLGITFVIGMLLVDGVNGVWVYKLMKRTDQMSLRVSRGLVLALSLFSLGIACWALFSLIQPRVLD